MQQVLNLDGSTVPFLPAVLTNDPSHGWYVYYYVFNPMTALMERRVVKLNRVRKHYRTQQEFRAFAANYVMEINAKLANGWSPFTTEENVRYYKTIHDISKKYLAEKQKDMSSETMRSYESFIRIFIGWLDEHYPNCKCIQFQKQHAIEFLDYIYNDYKFIQPKKDENGRTIHKPRTKRQQEKLPDSKRTEEKSISPNTYNNYVRNARTFFSWLVEKCYLKENPFMGMKLKEKEKKKRTLATIEDRDKIRNYFMETCPNFLIIAELVFNSLIRPAEIARIRVGQVHLNEKVIRLDEEQTKTGYARDCVLTDELIEILANMLAPGYPDDYFLISTGFQPGEKPLTTKAYNKRWLKMREVTGISETIQLYSLRDSGLTGMFEKGADANTVKQAADHHDLKITSIYCNHVDKELVSKVRKYTPKF